MCCLSALIKFLEVRLDIFTLSLEHTSCDIQLLSDESNFGAYRLSTFDFSQYLRLDNSAVRALNLEAQAGDPNTFHLFGVLNHTASPQGQRLLQQWLRQPLLDKNRIGKLHFLVKFVWEQKHAVFSLNCSIEERLDLVEIFFSDLSVRRTVQDCLKVVPDYFRLAKKLNKGKGSLQVIFCTLWMTTGCSYARS